MIIIELKLESADEYGTTPVECCLEKENYYALQLLIQRGANITTEEHGKYLIKVASEGRTDVVQLLLNRGINPNFVDKQKETALFKSIKNRYFHTSELLIKYGANTKLKNSDNLSPLDLARMQKSQLIINLLEDACEIRRKHQETLKMTDSLEDDKGFSVTRGSYKSNTENYIRKNNKRLIKEIVLEGREDCGCCHKISN